MWDMVRVSDQMEKMDFGRVPGAAWSREAISLPLFSSPDHLVSFILISCIESKLIHTHNLSSLS